MNTRLILCVFACALFLVLKIGCTNDNRAEISSGKSGDLRLACSDGGSPVLNVLHALYNDSYFSVFVNEDDKSFKTELMVRICMHIVLSNQDMISRVSKDECMDVYTLFSWIRSRVSEDDFGDYSARWLSSIAALGDDVRFVDGFGFYVTKESRSAESPGPPIVAQFFGLKSEVAHQLFDDEFRNSEILRAREIIYR